MRVIIYYLVLNLFFFRGDEGDNLLPCFKLILFFTAVSDKVYQFLAHGWWFSLGTPASPTTKTGRHDIAESGIKHNK